jgi:hypothetical protein
MVLWSSYLSLLLLLSNSEGIFQRE